jgi:hypothetical protein
VYRITNWAKERKDKQIAITRKGTGLTDGDNLPSIWQEPKVIYNNNNNN